MSHTHSYILDVLNDPEIVRDYVQETLEYDYPALSSNQKKTSVTMAALSAAEVEHLIRDVDNMLPTYKNEEAARMVAEDFSALIIALRSAKYYSASNYGGARASGRELVCSLLRTTHIGRLNVMDATSTNGAGATGVYGGLSGTGLSWTNPAAWVILTSKTFIPTQTMADAGALAIFGFTDNLEVPKVDGYRLTTGGTTGPVLPLDFIRSRSNSGVDTKVAKLVEPIVITPKTSFALDLWATETGDDAPVPIAFVFGMASLMTV